MPLLHDFEGNYFGNYVPKDFEDFDNYECDNDSDEEADDQPNHSKPSKVHADDSDEESDAEDAANFKDEAAWEPPPSSPPLAAASPVAAHLDKVPPLYEGGEEAIARAHQERAHDHLHSRTYVVRFPSTVVGAPLSDVHMRSEYGNFESLSDPDHSNPYAPFVSKIDWEFACWAKMRGPGLTAVSELLAIKEIPQLLGLSYNTASKLNAIIDNKLSSGRPHFTRREIIVAGEAFEVFYHNVITCVRALFRDPEFAGILIFAPERHYADADHTIHVYFDMHTGKWRWAQQDMEERDPGATIIPIIISLDKTQLTLFDSKTAYPVYMTIVNLLKDICRKPLWQGQILLAYLLTSNLAHITNKAARRRALANLYHTSMHCILKV
ncbi:hypothetical protein BN946_scf184766.g47 [Trametes cinnabarina]|uniref:Uncharacterized protein n=1 Tax=Pycnoporus cinnabarinus TaxID=5643 RepID=A0A060S5V0_PYCCI|nr:hypothetical protein BN946_scf184766.g47 [Trametes cinnabarina]